MSSAHRIWGPSDPSTTEPVSSIWSMSGNPYVQKLIEDGDMQQLAAGAVRVNFALSGGSGTQTTLVLAGGVSMHVIDAVLPNAVRAQIVADESVILLRASLSCDCSYTVPGLPTMVFNRPEIVLLQLTKGAQVQLDMGASTRQHGIHAYIRSAELLRFFELEIERLPAPLRRVFEGETAGGRLISLPLDSHLGALVEAMTRPIADISLQRLFLRGKLMELMAVLLDAAARNPTFAGPESLRPHERNLAYRARDELNRTYADPPRFADLAKELGTNRNKLKIIFREVFGLTLTEYCGRRRVSTAQSLLLEGRLSIGQIAEQVGYEHQSSFTAAFREQVGMTPREYSRQRAALDMAIGTTDVVRPTPIFKP